MRYTVIDLNAGREIKLIGTISRETALKIAASNDGGETTEGTEKGIIRLDLEGWMIAIPELPPVELSEIRQAFQARVRSIW